MDWRTTGPGSGRISNWDALADRENFVSVYPDGTLFPLRWGADERFNVEVNDVQFFRDLVADISGWMAKVIPKVKTKKGEK